MALKLKYEKHEDIPEGFESLYTGDDEKGWQLTEVEGLQTKENVSRLEEALRKEKNDHKETRAKLRAFEGVDPETIHDDMDELKELRALKEAGDLGEGKIDDAKVDELVEQRIQRRLAPLERDKKKLEEENSTLKGDNESLRGEITSGKIQSAIRQHAEKAKVAPTAIDDVVALGERLFQVDEDGTVVARDQVGITPGITPEIWLQEARDSKPHWWPQSNGGGAGGGGDNGPGGVKNPWSAANWNVTEQGRIVRDEGRERADQLARAAGSKVGAIRPPEQRKQAG